MSPFQLLYGFQPRDPLALSLPAFSGGAVESTTFLLAQLRDDLLAAQRAVAVAQTLQKQYADRRRRDHSFHVGDRVMLSTANLGAYAKVNKKLRARWCGPFTVSQVVNPVAVKLDLPPTIKIHPVVHAEWLKPVPAHAPSGVYEVPDSEDDDELVPVSAVDVVLKSEKRKGKVWYLVRWTDLPAWDCTWHTRVQLLAADPDSGPKLDAYHKLTRGVTSLQEGE